MALIANGCEEWGFFQLVNHGIPEELLGRVKNISSECYKLEREENFKSSAPVKLLNEMVEKKSGEKLENVGWEDVFTLLDDNEWPEKTPGFRISVYELKKLAERVKEVMDGNLELPKGYLKKALNGGEGENAFFGAKVSHYPPCPCPELVNSLQAHTDAGGVILLFQDDQVGGLQILKDGQWIDIQPLPNAIFINTGDQIEVLSNGRYKSCWHRVLVTPDRTRRSIASFYNPSFQAIICPATQLLAKEDQAAAYPRFIFHEYMSVYTEQKFLPKETRFQAVRAI